MNTLHSDTGTYILILHLAASTTLTIGRLGTFTFAEGWYGYVGSAFGSGGLRGRLWHHLTPASRPHWHIDYLRQAARLIEIWYSSAPCEHSWAATLRALPSASVPAARFGASDCRCEAHLFHFGARPALTAFQAVAECGAAIRCVRVETS
jgi:Uri superfamily endonuclease